MKYFSSLIIILLFSVSTIQAKQTDTDPIQQVLVKSKKYRKTNADSAFFWGRKALAMAINVNDTDIVAQCQSNIALIYKHQQAYDSALWYMQQSCLNLKAANATTKDYFRNSMKLGELQQLTGRYQQASETYQQLLPMCDTNLSLKVRLTGTLLNTKLICCEYDRAFYYCSILEELEKEMDDKSQIWFPWYAKANIYFELKEYDKSIEYITKLKNFADTAGIEPVMAIYHGFISGIDVYYTKDYRKALDHLRQSLSIWEKIKHKEQIGFTSLYIAFVYGKLSQWAMAEEYYKQAEKYLKPLGINKKLYEMYRYMAETYYDWGKYKKAQKYANQALEMHKHFGLRIEIPDVYKILSDVAKKEGNFPKALEYLQLHNNYKDSIYSMARINSVKYMEQDYIEKEKQYKIDLLSLKNEHQKTLLSKQKQLNSVLAAALILLIFGGVLGYNNVRQKRHLQKEESQRLALQSELKGQEEERNRIAKDLHDGVVSNLTGLKYQLNNMEINTPGMNEAVSRISEISSEIRFISHNLATPLFVNANLQEVLVQFAREVSSKQNLTIKTIFYPVIDWSEVSSVFQIETYRVIQEIVSNTLKHANATHLTIQLVKYPDSFNIDIEDNGKGFIVDTQKSGIGIQNIKKRIEALNGEITIESSPDGPTTYMIEVPQITTEETMVS